MPHTSEANKILRQHALEIFRAGLAAADPLKAIFRHVKVSDDVLEAGGHPFVLSDVDRIFVVGGGKAGASMGRALEKLLGDRIADGVIVTKQGYGLPLRNVRLVEAGHPVPDNRGIQGTGEILSLVKGARERDLVLCLISGGGSALSLIHI